MKKFYTSDLHLGHKNIIDYDNRPFKNLEEMTEIIINNWNKTVSKDDLIYVLGDMFWDNNLIETVMPQLNGIKFLIKGNHDRINSSHKKYFEWIKDCEVIKDGEDHVVLFHYPIAHWINADHDYVHLYGHIHAGRDSRPFKQYEFMMAQRKYPYECYNVGCMLHDYKPVTLDTLRNKRFLR